MTEVINLFVVSLFIFFTGMFFVITIREPKRGETLVKTCFMAGIYLIIFVCLQVALDCKIIDKNLFMTLIIIEFIVYIAITFYAHKYVKSTAVYK